MAATFSGYDLFQDENSLLFEFTSIGPHGSIKKIVQFSKIDDRIYNLGFGDLNPETGHWSDKIVTNNGDTERVLLTVAQTAYLFSEKYPDSWIYVEGSTPSRTRLYRIGISKFLEVLQEDFVAFGWLENQWVPYRVDTQYDAFLFRRKMI